MPRCLRDAFGCEGGLPSPDVLAYLFDNEQELDRLLKQFSTLLASDVQRAARAALIELQFHASSLVKTLHRRRALVPDSTKFMRVIQSSKRAKASPEPCTQIWLAQSGAKHLQGKFKSRRVRQLARVEDASGRAEVEERELSRWRQELARLVVEADLPVLEPMLLVRHRESALVAALGNARASTIRKRVREWRKVRAYCLAVSGSAWPSHIGIILDYLHERRLEPCACTVPAAILASFAFIEKVGAVRPAERLSDSQVLRNTVNQLTADLESKAPPRRKAPMLPVAMIGAMELAVSDVALPCYLRCFAFYKLVKLWTASRCSDTGSCHFATDGSRFEWYFGPHQDKWPRQKNAFPTCVHQCSGLCDESFVVN